jgi:putative hydrolase of the HAD superfamily
VLFDVYGTLLLDAARPRRGPLCEASRVSSLLRRHGVPIGREYLRAALAGAIEQQHAELRGRGVPHPEVRIERLWSALLPGRGDDEVRAIAAGWEAAVRPVLPAPGCRALLARLRGAGLALGIVSNSQFYTPGFLEVLLGGTLQELGFAASLCCWSYELLSAKPGPDLFAVAAARLAAMGIQPSAALVVGNDPAHDIAPASALGFMTALVGDPPDGAQADVLIGRLEDLVGLLAAGG